MDNFVLAIDIGGTNTKLALVDGEGKAGQVRSIPSSQKGGLHVFLDKVANEARLLITESKGIVDGIGIGVAGFVDPKHTKMIFNPNIPWLENVDLKKYFANTFGLPVYIEIDSNAAALAEAVFGAGQDYERVLVLAVGTGLGGGMVVNGQIVRISNECLGDIGHVLVDADGIACASGCRGCAEALVSSSALIRYASEFMIKDKSSIGHEKAIMGALEVPFIIQAIQAKDDAALKAIDKMGGYLGHAMGSIAPVFEPNIFCIAGGISEAGDPFINAAKKRFFELTGTPYSKGVSVKKARMGWQSVLIGSAEAFRSQQEGFSMRERFMHEK